MTRKNSIKYKERQAILRCERFSDQEIIMEKDKTYVKNILDPEFSSNFFLSYDNHFCPVYSSVVASQDCCGFQHQRLYIWIVSRMKHHSFACVHHRESGLEVFSTSDSIVACVSRQCGQLCKKHSLVCSGGRKAVWKAKFLLPGTKLLLQIVYVLV
jgi:hypothetical protein